MFLKTPIAPLAGLFFCLLAAPAQPTELYRWQDERGVVHFSDNPYNIPEEFRENTTTIRSLAPSRGSQRPHDYGQRAWIPLKKKGMTAVVPATINDGPQADFILDTGASYTVISTSVAESANIDLSKQYPKVRLQTANGIIDAPLVNLESIEIDGLRVTDLTVAVHDFAADDSIAGLLGLNFLSHFRMDLDARNGLLILERK